MSVSINFLVNNVNTLAPSSLLGSGLGFYGNGFGTSVQVGQFAQTVYIADSSGTVQGAKGSAIVWIANNSGQLAGGDNQALRSIPNNLATLIVELDSTTPVQTQNTTWSFFDRVSIANPPSGVEAFVAELVHISPVEGPTGSGSVTWSQSGGLSGGLINGVTYAAPLSLSVSPGPSGTFPSGSSTVHNWYLGISCSPSVIGSSYFAGVFATEYL